MGVSNPVIKGDLQTLVRVSLPIFLFLFSETLTAWCERIFLSYHSVEAVSSSLNGTYLASLFQNPCIAIASMAQVFVGLYQGSGEFKRMGPCVWQLIWFSIFSLVLTLPLSSICSDWYFKRTSMEILGNQYFKILALGNFLFPLNIALTSFYIARGKTITVSCLLLASYGLNILLCWTLIFGIEGFVPACGIRGAALAKCLSLSLSCLIFGGAFLSKKNRELYGTSSWQFSPRLLWSYLKPGLVRAFGYIWFRGGWVVISYMTMKKGGIYLDIQTIGGTVITFLIFIVTGVYRSILTIASNLLGNQNYPEIAKLSRSLILYVGMIGAILAIPLFLYPQSLAYFFNGTTQALFATTFPWINHWVWLYLILLTFQMGLCGFLVAARDLKTQIYAYFLTALTSLLPIYLTIWLGSAAADQLWLIMAMEEIVLILIFWCRWVQKKRILAQNRPI